MSKPLSKGKKIVLSVLIVAVLLGICFACVAIYAKREFEKEKSWLPPKPYAQHASATELPDDIHGAYEYVMRLYNEALHADDAEGSWYTDVDLGGDMTLPFSEADNAIVSKIRDGAAGSIKELYPTADGVKMSEEKAEDLPEIDLKESDILEYPYDPELLFNRKGEYFSDTYEIVFKIDPSFENADEIRNGGVYEGVCELLKDAVTVNDVDLDVQNVEMRFSIDRLTDRMLSAEVSRQYMVNADVTLTDDYAAMLEDAGTKEATVSLPYKATEKVSFMWYGLRFLEDYLEVKPADITTLPLEIHVNGASVQGEDFVVTYTASDPETLKIEDDGTMTVLKTDETSETDGVTVTATLSYEGKNYEDELTIYITNLDKATVGVRFYEDGFTATVGSTVLLPAEVRVPINEAAESQQEEEYELTCETSDPTALTVEADGKDLYVTALKTADAPVTVSVTMNCGGHTYQAEIPVTITEGTEAENNG